MPASPPIDDIHGGLIRALRAFRSLVGSLPTEVPGVGRVTPDQFALLAHLRDRAPATMGEVATARSIAINTATAIVDRLVAQGWIERRADPQDRRLVMVTLTAAGQHFVSDLLELRQRRLRSLLEHLSGAELHALSAATPVIDKLAELARLEAWV